MFHGLHLMLIRRCRRIFLRKWAVSRRGVAVAMWAGSVILSGCKSSGDYRREADEVASNIIHNQQQAGLGHVEPFTIQPPAKALRKRLLLSQDLPYLSPESLGTQSLSPLPHWPNDNYLRVHRHRFEPWLKLPRSGPLTLTLTEALQVAAHSSRSYQTRKESVYQTALALDLERNEFRTIFAGVLDANVSDDLAGPRAVAGATSTDTISAVRQLKNGITFTSRLGIDLVKLLTGNEDSTLGIFGDASVSVPFLRGAGRYVVTEPLTQARRNVLYAIYNFERFKRTFAVNVATSYLDVLEAIDQVDNARENYKRLTAAAQRSKRLADAGRLPRIQLDQAVQNKLAARERYISAQASFERRLDSFKLTLGLPTDANIALDHSELQRLGEAVRKVLGLTPPARVREEPRSQKNVPLGEVPGNPNPTSLVAPGQPVGGPYELPQETAIKIALKHRLDLRVARGSIYDAQRGVTVAANRFLPELTLLGQANLGENRGLGSANLPTSTQLSVDRARYNALLTLDLPLERTQERNDYRRALITLERSIRDLQEQEDQIKLDIRNDLRQLKLARNTTRIQAQAVTLARRRVDSTSLFLEAGRAEIRDLLEAQASLISSQNSLTSSLVNYRVNELNLQRDMGVLKVGESGLWKEYPPSNLVDTSKGRNG